MNAVATMSNTAFMAGAAFSIVAQVWGTAMSIWHPHLRPVLQWVTWTPFLVLLPYILAIPLFVIGISVGLQDRSKVYRGSPLYCVVDKPSLQVAGLILGAVFTFICLVLAAWTSIKLISTRRHTEGTRLSQDLRISYALTFRVMIFSLFVGAAFVSGIIALNSSLYSITPDITSAFCGVGAFFIFASATPIVRFVFTCQRDLSVSRSSRPSTTLTSWRSARAGHTTQSEPANEFVLTSIHVEGERKPCRTSFDVTRPQINPMLEHKFDWEPAS